MTEQEEHDNDIIGARNRVKRELAGLTSDDAGEVIGGVLNWLLSEQESWQALGSAMRVPACLAMLYVIQRRLDRE